MKQKLLLTTSLFLFLGLTSIHATQSTPTRAGETPDAKMTMDQTRVDVGADFSIHFTNAPTDSWIGIYPFGKGPENAASYKWAHTKVTNGSLTFNIDESNAYTAVIFKDGDVHNPFPERLSFFVGREGTFSIDKATYRQGEQITISYNGLPALDKDWFGIYTEGKDPNGTGITADGWKYAPVGVQDGTLSMSTGVDGDIVLPPGSYFITYMIRDEHYEPMPRQHFTVTASTSIKQVSDVSEITYDKTQKRLVLNTTQGGTLSVYAADGKKLADKTLKGGKNFVPLNAVAHQLLIVTWKGNDGKTTTHKIHF